MRPIKSFFRTGWQGVRACARGVLAAAHWTAWIVLLTILGFQIFILTAQQLTLPAFVSRQLAASAETYGLKVEFGRAQFDPLGRILLENVRLSPPLGQRADRHDRRRLPEARCMGLVGSRRHR